MEFSSLTESRLTRLWNATRPCEMLLVSDTFRAQQTQAGRLCSRTRMTSGHRVAGSILAPALLLDVQDLCIRSRDSRLGVMAKVIKPLLVFLMLWNISKVRPLR